MLPLQSEVSDEPGPRFRLHNLSMAKRKRDHEATIPALVSQSNGTAAKVARTNGLLDVKTSVPVIQIITGSYERVLHGISASISTISSSEVCPSVQFADTFLFNAHTSAIRCLALSPLPEPGSADSQGVYLATGSSDERVNVYRLSAAPPAENDKLPPMPSLGNNKISEDPRNRELGSLMHHSSNVTALHFPTRSKLLSAAEDNTIAITRVKDLTVVSTLKAPHPKVFGQPSGDTNPPGVTPAGVNDFAVHPSMKLMVSVGRGERCMRLWNLVTGKKAGVLNFNRDILQSIKESKYSSGEGRRIKWNPQGTEFAVAFERGAVIFGEDSKAKRRILPHPLTKLHQIYYVSVPDDAGLETEFLALSTEDGRILFYSTDATSENNEGPNLEKPISDARLCATLGGNAVGINGRVKDFEILSIDSEQHGYQDAEIITAGSDGIIRVWHLPLVELSKAAKSEKATQVGSLIGTHETASRITCLRAFVMLSAVDEEAGLSEFEGLTEDGEDLSIDSDVD